MDATPSELFKCLGEKERIWQNLPRPNILWPSKHILSHFERADTRWWPGLVCSNSAWTCDLRFLKCFLCKLLFCSSWYKSYVFFKDIGKWLLNGAIRCTQCIQMWFRKSLRGSSPSKWKFWHTHPRHFKHVWRIFAQHKRYFEKSLIPIGLH